MQAYKYNDLYNKYVDEQATNAMQSSCISVDSYTNILKAYPNKLYTPNYFIRLALGLLTIVAVFFSGLLMFLLFSASGTSGMIGLLIFLAISCYISLELFIQRKGYYNAGVDNILMVLGVIFLVSCFFVSDLQVPLLAIIAVVMVIALWMSIRFTDAFMASVFYCCFFAVIFLSYIRLGDIAKSTAPFIMMAVSALVYFVIKKLINSKTFMYRFCFKAVMLLTLLTFYASGNYFVVKELGNQMFNSGLALNDAVPAGWLFWVLTFVMPPVYIIYGVLKKDLLVLRTGLGLIAATIFTVKYYYTILTVETEMLIAGITLIALSYFLIRYLATPRSGFTSRDMHQGKRETLNIEALIIAETFNKQPVVKSDGLYGGGSGGGGGATGEY